MSIERDLLRKLVDAINLLDYRQELDRLTVEIKELLAQPNHIPGVGNMIEQEPVAWCQLVEGKVQDLLTSFEMKDWVQVLNGMMDLKLVLNGQKKHTVLDKL